MNGFGEPIEGETPIDQSGLKIPNVRDRNALLPYEAENIRKATVKYLAVSPSSRLAPFNYAWLLKLHQEMFGDVWTWAGKPRTRNMSLGVPWERIGEELGGLVLDIEAWAIRDDLLLEQSVTLHHRGVSIHPFENGNGRWARMLADIWLRRHGKRPIEWPQADPGNLASHVRQEYLTAIREADKHDRGLLTELHERFWPNA